MILNFNSYFLYAMNDADISSEWYSFYFSIHYFNVNSNWNTQTFASISLFIILIFLQGILMIMSIPLSKRDTRKRVDCVSCNMHLHELVHNATWVLSFTSYLFSLRTIIIMLNKIIIQRDNYNSLTWKTN